MFVPRALLSSASALSLEPLWEELTRLREELSRELLLDDVGLRVQDIEGEHVLLGECAAYVTPAPVARTYSGKSSVISGVSGHGVCAAERALYARGVRSLAQWPTSLAERTSCALFATRNYATPFVSEELAKIAERARLLVERSSAGALVTPESLGGSSLELHEGRIEVQLRAFFRRDRKSVV